MAGDEDRRTYKIGEVCRLADLQPYVLRYWETEFPALAPNKSSGGQRLYSQHEVEIIQRIKELLYSEGFTIAGAKKKLEGELSDSSNEDESRGQISIRPGGRDALQEVKRELRDILRILGK